MEGEIYFTQGTHPSDGSSTGIKSGIDLAPKRVVSCTPGIKAVAEEQQALATASGTITIVGNEKDVNDPNHSIVEVQEDDTGLRFGVMHLDKLPDHVQVGNGIRIGTPIGKASCEVPKGGKTTGVHLHQYVKDRNGKYLPIDGFTFSGWTVQGDTMTKGNEKRVADQRRCNTGQVCGGIRNDLVLWLSAKGPLDALGISDPLPTVAPARPTPVPAPTREVPKPTVKAQVPAMPWAQFSLGGLVEGGGIPTQGFKRIGADLWVKNLTSSWQTFSDSPTGGLPGRGKTIDSSDFEYPTEVEYSMDYLQTARAGIPIPPKGAVRFHIVVKIPATRQPKMFMLQSARDAIFLQLTVPFAGGNTPKALFEKMTDFPEQSTETTLSCPRDRDIKVKLNKLVPVKDGIPYAKFDLTIHNKGGKTIKPDDYSIIREAWSSSGMFLETQTNDSSYQITGPSIPPDRDGIGSMGVTLAYDFGSGYQNKPPVATYPQLVRITIYPGERQPNQPACTRRDMLFRIDGP